MVLVLEGLVRQMGALLIGALLLAGCGGDTRLRLAFELPEGASILADVTQVELTASRDGARVAFISADYVPGMALLLEGIEKDGAALTLSLTARGDEGAPRAYGVLGSPATDSIRDAGDVCCLTMCLCSVAYHDANGCDCGSQACQACD